MSTTTAEDREWMIDGACTGEPPSLFYPTQGHVPARAKDICRGCPVKEKCLDYSIEIRDWEGVWGGVPGRKRRAIAQARGIYVD
jgi:WhiB family redox-sensing transcriptional regulator